MKPSKQFLFFTLTVFGFAAVECVLTAFLSPMLEESLFLTRVFPFVARVLAVIPPFLAIGTAVGAVRTRSFSYGLAFFGIYAAVLLFSQIPLSLLAYSPESSAPYAVLLLSYMISATVTALLFFLALLLGYAIFLRDGEYTESTPLLSLRGGSARAIALVACILTLYHLVLEVIGIFTWAKENLYIISAEDLISMLFSLLFFLLLGVFCFVTGRVAELVFKTAEPEELTDEGDFI